MSGARDVTIKIDAPKSRYGDVADGLPNQTRVRIVREADWRRIMAVVNEVAAGIDVGHYMGGHVAQKIDALRKHVEKRKERKP